MMRLAQDRERVEILDAEGGGPELAITPDGGSATAVVWPGMGARQRSLHRISLPPTASTVELRHLSEAVYYVVDGIGQVADGHGMSQSIEPGSMVHVEANTSYMFRAGNEPLELVGGPSPPDPTLYG
jgi:mannose-6-phosphate isomerase-like protein (cupin superfamily)